PPPASPASGLGQRLIAGRRQYLGANADTTDCALQLLAFRGYVRDRYGTAENAKAFWIAHSCDYAGSGWVAPPLVRRWGFGVVRPARAAEGEPDQHATDQSREGGGPGAGEAGGGGGGGRARRPG